MRMKIHVFIVIVVLICTLLSGQVYAVNQSVYINQSKSAKSTIVFGPKTYIKEKNKSPKFTANFSLKDTNGTFTLVVTNVSKVGRINASIKLNEGTAIKLNESVRKNEAIEMPIKDIKSSNRLLVELTGSVGSSISITIKNTQELKSSPSQTTPLPVTKSVDQILSLAQIISLSETNYDFGSNSIKSSAKGHTFIVTNNSKEKGVILEISLSDNECFTIKNDNVSRQLLAPGKSGIFDVLFTPDKEKDYSCIVTAKELSSGKAITINLIGYGETIPVAKSSSIISVSDMEYNFKEISIGSSSPAHTFTVTNNSTDKKMNFSINLSNTANFEIVNGPMVNRPLDPGQRMTFDLIFKPSTEGECTGIITLIDMQTGVYFSVKVSGTGVK